MNIVVCFAAGLNLNQFKYPPENNQFFPVAFEKMKPGEMWFIVVKYLVADKDKLQKL